MFLSIIIPVYNVAPYVERCLLSALNQADKDVEVIIVDDCGQDHSMEVVSQVIETHPNGSIVRIFRHQHNSGLSAARNTGLSVAQGKYVWFVDSDDWIAANCLHRIYNELNKSNPDICLISAAKYFENQSVQMFSFPELAGKLVDGKSFIVKRKIRVEVPFSIYKRTFLTENQLQFKTGIFHEDFEFSLRSYYLAKNVTYIDEIIYFYYQNPTSITQKPNPKKSFDYMIVAESLFEFSKTHVEKTCLPFFNNYISLAINEALRNFSKINDKFVINEWENKLFENKHLISCMLQSSIFKYRIEGLIFKMFKKYVFIYKLLQLFNKQTCLNAISK